VAGRAGAAGARAVELVILPDAEAVAARAAEELVLAARAGLDIALSGGSTPRRAYELGAATEPDWSRARIWWSDERAVPPDDPRSNYRLARESLLARLAQQPAAVHRVRGELGAEAAATELDAALEGVTLGLALLGLGGDGHTASLFPGKASVGEGARRAVAAEPGLEPWVERVTLTVPSLCAATRVVFLVTGERKAEAAARAFAGPPDPATPASLVRSATGTTLVLLDRAAGALLARS
jgi:6-phosphogluconolactonase